MQTGIKKGSLKNTFFSLRGFVLKEDEDHSSIFILDV